jgi:hypothetical protein
VKLESAAFPAIAKAAEAYHGQASSVPHASRKEGSPRGTPVAQGVLRSTRVSRIHWQGATMNIHHRPGKPRTWLLAALCVCSHFSQAAEAENLPPVIDGPYISNVASTASGNVIEQTGGVSEDWKPRANKHHVGLSIGKARFNVPCIEGMVCRRSGRAITLHAGSDLSKRLGFELAYMRMSNTVHEGNAIRVRGLNVNMLGELPLASSVTLTGRVGANYARTRMDVATATGAVSGKAQGFGLSYGVGLNWDISDRWSAATDLNRHSFKFVTGRDTVDTATVNLRYRY